MAASTIDYPEAGALLSELIRVHGWKPARLARAAGVADPTVRKYIKGLGNNPEPEYLERIARVFGSRDGAKLLYEYGLDERARALASENREPLKPHELVETPEPVDLTLVTEAVRRQGELLEEIVEFLHRQGFAASVNRDKPGYLRPVASVIDITDRVDRPMHSQAVGF